MQKKITCLFFLLIFFSLFNTENSIKMTKTHHKNSCPENADLWSLQYVVFILLPQFGT